MTVQLEGIDISTVDQGTGSWFVPIGCHAASGPVCEWESAPLLPTFPSYGEKPKSPVGGRTASPGTVETGKVGGGSGEINSPQPPPPPPPRLFLFLAMQKAHASQLELEATLTTIYTHSQWVELVREETILYKCK